MSGRWLRRGAIGLCAVVVAAACAADSTDTGAEATTPPSSNAGAAAPVTDLTVVTLNVLHGLPVPDGCGVETDFCQAPDRLDLLWTAIDEQAGCPDVVALQEIAARQQELVPDRLGDLCAGSYELLSSERNDPIQVMILTSLPVVSDGFVDISGPPWTAHVARLDAEIGTVDVLTSHFASSQFNPDCGSAADVECDPACTSGIEMGSCNAIEAVAALDATAADADLQLLVGDLNKELDDPRMQIVTDARFDDVWLLAGNPECGTTGDASPDACTSGVEGDSSLDGLDEPDQQLDSRIDFVMARAADGCDLIVDGPDDGDGDGTATGLFAVGPRDPPVKGLVWFSDHQGVMADIGLECG